MKSFSEFINSQSDELSKHLGQIQLTPAEMQTIVENLERRFSTSWLGFSKWPADETTLDWPLPGHLDNKKRVIIMTIRGACIGSGLFTAEFRVILY